MNDATNTFTLPVLALKNTVVFPYALAPIAVGRPGSVAAVEAALASEEKLLVVFAQRDASVEKPGERDLHRAGTLAVIKQMGRPAPGQIQLLVQGLERVTLKGLEQSTPFLKGVVDRAPLSSSDGPELEALRREVLDLVGKALGLVKSRVPFDIGLVGGDDNAERLVFVLASMFGFEVEKEQRLLEAPNLLEAFRLLHSFLAREVEVLELRSEIQSQAQTEMDREQREYLLRHQMRAIQQELGEQSPEQAEIGQLRERVEKAELPEQARREAERELARMERLPAASPEYGVIRSYIDFVVELPWKEPEEAPLDLGEARRILDEDHYGLEEVKDRILEHLAVLRLNPRAKAPILCFTGPPGTGKTSLGQSIARALRRKFKRMSLGGLHDEAELRGHRRTYIGAMPGRILQAIRRAGVRNPLLMLDEVDKLGRDFRGDPAAALLEILDPEQNREFHDNYLDLAFDLSRVFFITTANSPETVPAPLLDRMEVIRLSGYTDEEKMEIAKRYLFPRRLSEAGLGPEQCALDAAALAAVIRRYTREAGVRELERRLGKLVRRVALRIAEDGSTPAVTIGTRELADLLGPERFFMEEARKELPAGVAPGLAWTESGGDVLYVEATLLPDSKDLILTGHLGEVMKESARAARSYLWSHAGDLDIDLALFRDSGVHVHVPAGAIPKDGPSAGITIAAALASLYSGEPLRSDTALTGEITLTGLVLPVGGLKEKVLAGRRAGIKRIILPVDNRKDLRDLPADVLTDVEFVFVERIEDVLREARSGAGGRLRLQPVG